MVYFEALWHLHAAKRLTGHFKLLSKNFRPLFYVYWHRFYRLITTTYNLAHYVCLNFWLLTSVDVHFSETGAQKVSIQLSIWRYASSRAILIFESDLLAQAVDVSESLGYIPWHVLVKVLMTLTCLLQSVADKLLCWVLIDIVLQPRQIKTVQTERHEIE